MTIDVEHVAGRLRFRVRVVPRAARTRFAGIHDGALRVRLAAPPVDGKANAALVRFLADALDVPRRALRIVRGETSRSKTLEVDADAERVMAALRAVAGDG
jgi:uncharacterized protein (TIGR00251 family)